MSLKKKIKIFLGKNFPITYSKILFRIRQGYKLNLLEPKSFNEKLMWLKINCYYNNEIVWKCSDKFEVRNYALQHGVKNINLLKLFGVFEKVEDIPYQQLPQKFALKCSHGCGFNIICTNKDKLNIEETNKKLNTWLNTKFGFESAENHYTHIKPVIIAEEYIDSNQGLPYDYKIYCYDGVPKGILVCSEREKKLRLNFFDLNWKELPYINDKYLGTKDISKPKKLNDMLEIAKKVSSEFPFVRVDFYEYKNNAIMGEMTFTPACCVADYYTDKGNLELGKLLNIKKIQSGKKKRNS